MKTCDKCAASNFDNAKFCNECGASLEALADKGAAAPDSPPTPPAPPVGEPSKAVDAAAFAASLQQMASKPRRQARADILFVLDCTSSMQGEIEAIKETILSFSDTIEQDGVRVRVGLVEFRDRLINEEHRVLQFAGEPFTKDVSAFRREVSALRASGGGDIPESSLDALMLALRQPFSADADPVIVLISDAPPHIPDRETGSLDEVAAAIKAAGIKQLYLVIRIKDKASQIYLKLLEGTKGLAFDLGEGDDFLSRAEGFKRTLRSLGKTISQGTL